MQNQVLYTNHLEKMEASVLVENQQLFETMQFLFDQLWNSL